MRVAETLRREQVRIDPLALEVLRHRVGAHRRQLQVGGDPHARQFRSNRDVIGVAGNDDTGILQTVSVGASLLSVCCACGLICQPPEGNSRSDFMVTLSSPWSLVISTWSAASSADICCLSCW